MFSCFRSKAEADEVTRKNNSISDNLTMRLLRRWDFFRQMRDENLLQIKAFYVFSTSPQMSCRGGLATIFITANDWIFGMGHNCSNINILGFSRNSKGYKNENVTNPLAIRDLSHKGILDLSIGGLLGAAITGDGALLWWGVCSRRYGDLRTPHIPRNGKRRFIKVACGLRMVAALSESRKVYIWGQVGFNHPKYMEGEVLVSNPVMSDISCGLHHIAMIDVDGHVFTWGRGSEGQRSLIDYSYGEQYEVTKMDIDPCAKIKCGPNSTFCLTRFLQLWACGSNGNRYLGTQDRSNQVKNLSKIFTKEEFSELVVLWRPDNTSQMAATTTSGDMYTWGNSPTPCISDYRSFFDFFTNWEATPGMVSVCFPDPVCSVSSLIRVTPRELRSINAIDVLTYVYIRDHPELPPSKRRSPRLSIRDVSYLSSQITCEESGKNFILEKFFNDIYTHTQDEPPAFRTANATDCVHSRLCSTGDCWFR